MGSSDGGELMPVTPFGVEVGILYRLTGPDGTSVSFNDSAQWDFVGFTEEVTGLDGPDTRESADLIVEGDGGYHGNFYHGRRPIVLSGIIDPNTFGSARNTMVSNLLRATNAMRQDAVLSWTPTGGDPVAVAVRRQQPPRVTGGRVKSFQVALVAADPRVYGTAVRTLARTSEASPSGWWGHMGDGEYDASAGALSPTLLLPFGSVAGLTNRGSAGASGNGFAVGSPTIGGYSPGPVQRGENFATDLDGTSQWINTSYNPFTNGTTRTFSGWANLDAIYNNQGIFGGSAATGPILFVNAAGNVYFGAQNSGHTAWAGAWPGAAQWVHWAVVFDEAANTAALYINGALVSSQAQTTAYHATPGNLQIGTFSSIGAGLALNGKVRSFGVFPRALTAAEIKWLYEEGARAMAFNRGNADTPAVMRITGPITNPVIWNMHWTGGTLFTLTGTISAGNWWEIDTSDGTIVDQAGANQYGKMVFASSEWKDLKPGVNDLRLVGTGTTGATELKLTWKDAWI